MKRKCEGCNGTKIASFLPNSNTVVYFGHEAKVQKELNQIGAGKLEKRPCSTCTTKVVKVIKIKDTKHDNPHRAGKTSPKKNHP